MTENKPKSFWVNTKKLKNRIAIVLDRSSSMGCMRDQAIEMFNEQVDAIIEENEDMDTKVSLVTFSTEVDAPKIWNEPVDRLGKITRKNYRPSGCTAMYDAVGMTVDKLRALPEAEDPDCSFLVVVISDGYENSSKEYTSSMLAARVKKLQNKENWTFTYLGAEQDLAQVAAATGIHQDNMILYASSAGGMRGMSCDNSASIGSYMNSRKKGLKKETNFFKGKKMADVMDTTDDSVTVTTTTKSK
jgi:Mg-chelatase subunit ChlD